MRTIDPHTIRRSTLVAVGMVVATASACSSVSREAVGSSSEALVTIGGNATIAPLNMHEVALTEAKAPNGTWHWVAGINNCSNPHPATGGPPPGGPGQCDRSNNPGGAGLVGTSYSADLTAQFWTGWLPPPGCEEGTGAPPCDAAHWVPPGSPTMTGTFAGWVGDPSLATIRTGDPVNDGSVVVLTNVTWTTDSAALNEGSDVAMLVSGDGGQTWGSPTYLVDQNPADPGYHVGGADVDQPQVVSNPVAP